MPLGTGRYQKEATAPDGAGEDSLTCIRHAIAFSDFLGSRLSVPGEALIAYLPELIRCRGQPA
jgi:hypothetical protein